MPGIGELIDGAMQQAPQPLRHAGAEGGAPAQSRACGWAGWLINSTY
jgi:hypothetical protein